MTSPSMNAARRCCAPDCSQPTVASGGYTTTIFQKGLDSPSTRYLRAPLGQQHFRLVPTIQTQGGKPTIEKVWATAGVTPLCLRTPYGTVDYKSKAADRNKISLSNCLGELNNR
ncbi:hypothetical protein PMIN06_013161 [Paraphaeosphaeria minitans]